MFQTMQSFRQCRLPFTIMTNLDYVNMQVLCLVQALLDDISRNMRVISLIPRGKGATLQFLLEQGSAEDREIIENVVFEYFALRENGE